MLENDGWAGVRKLNFFIKYHLFAEVFKKKFATHFITFSQA